MFRHAIPIGRILGISIDLDYFWFLVFGLTTWILAVSYYPAEYKNWSVAEYWFIGAITAVMLLGDVTLQELVDKNVLAQRRRCFVVGNDKGSVGLITLPTITEIPRSAWPTTAAEQVMIPLEKIISIQTTAQLRTARYFLGWTRMRSRCRRWRARWRCWRPTAWKSCFRKGTNTHRRQ